MILSHGNFFFPCRTLSSLMQPYKVFMESDLKKMILDIIKFNIIKERGVTELLFFNEFHLSKYLVYVFIIDEDKGYIIIFFYS